MEQIKALRGTKDILPEEAARWAAIEDLARDLFAKYGYSQIRTPIIEETALFSRSIGDATDIVEKQMYTFNDRGGTSITLRPEATAPVVRALLEHNLDKKQAGLTKLFYIGAMFRAERPQAGRQRQFHQVGVEAIGSGSPYLDAEVISLAAAFLKGAGISDFKLKINSLGCSEDKKNINTLFKKELKLKAGQLCEDCRTRVEKNTFRVLDCKNPGCKKIAQRLAPIVENICPGCRRHFDSVRQALDLLAVPYEVDNHLVRGLDYYTKTTFELTSQKLGAQDAIAAGGRYDNLVSDLGGPDMPAAGFAAGMERLLLAQNTEANNYLPQQEIFIATLGEAAREKAFGLTNELRKSGIACIMEYQERSLKTQLKAAAANGCKYTAILGDDELKKDKIVLRDMAKSRQEEIDIDKIVEYIKNI